MIEFMIFIISAIFFVSCVFGATYVIKTDEKRHPAYGDALLKIFCLLLFVSLVVLCLAVAAMFQDIHSGLFPVVQK
jgi:hypothetical protein